MGPPDRGWPAGLTPAGAGNTDEQAPTENVSSAHPRGCGEHRMVALASANAVGSPPRVRGTRGDGRCGWHDAGLTPAGAGNTWCGLDWKTDSTAHPRGCGEHSYGDTPVSGYQGSPPRVRGTLDVVADRVVGLGLTPAGAGNTEGRASSTKLPKAHPRGCGEHIVATGIEEGQAGSPPRVRGTPLGARVSLLAGRLTPAGAGNTASAPTRLRPSRAHPRGCGEHIPSERHDGSLAGSPPRVRGTHAASGRMDAGWGLTPAGAGNTNRCAR